MTAEASNIIAKAQQEQRDNANGGVFLYGQDLIDKALKALQQFEAARKPQPTPALVQLQDRQEKLLIENLKFYLTHYPTPAIGAQQIYSTGTLGGITSADVDVQDALLKVQAEQTVAVPKWNQLVNAAGTYLVEQQIAQANARQQLQQRNLLIVGGVAGVIALAAIFL